MRINKFVALASGLSRRAADEAIQHKRVLVNTKPAQAGQDVSATDKVTLDGVLLTANELVTIMLHKPAGYVVSRNGQGSQTVYDLLPSKYHHLKPIGRLDKDSSGLLLLTNDGSLANELTHPSRQKLKIYEISLDRPLQPLHRQMIQDFGIDLEDGPSKLQLDRINEEDEANWYVRMSEGRNRQIRRTFAALGYDVTKLHRTHFGSYQLGNLSTGQLTEQ